ncbi:MAG: alkyl sulfatase dimerization domain-containing protein [Vicinamibacterales bacterium]
MEYHGRRCHRGWRARDDYRQGNYRWVAQVMDQVVYANPSNTEARALAANAFEQLGYLAESATWRNSYLLGAQELRNGLAAQRPRQALDAEFISAMPASLVFDYLGTTLNGPRAENATMVLNWRFTDTGESLASTVDHAALTYVMGKTAPAADATIVTTRAVFNAMVLRQRPGRRGTTERRSRDRGKHGPPLRAVLVPRRLRSGVRDRRTAPRAIEQEARLKPGTTTVRRHDCMASRLHGTTTAQRQ